MAGEKSKILFTAPKRRLLLSRLKYVVRVNGISYGPLSLDQPLEISGLMQGKYNMRGKIRGAGRFDNTFSIADASITHIGLASGLGLWSRLMIMVGRQPLFVDLVRETPQAEPGRVKQITSQFWLGWCDEADEITDFFSEEAYYARRRALAAQLDAGEITDNAFDLREQALDDSPITEFAKSQGEIFIDHDFIEWRWEPEGKALKEMFTGTSWVNMWADKVERRGVELGVKKVNCFVMVGMEGNTNPHQQIKQPCDITLKSGVLKHLGKITHDDDPLI